MSGNRVVIRAEPGSIRSVETTSEHRYRVEGVLGSGGFATVYRARLERADGFVKDVAIKVLHADDPPLSLLQRFRDEARILALVRDRAIVSVDPPIQVGGHWML